jgi:hypothetical protein
MRPEYAPHHESPVPSIQINRILPQHLKRDHLQCAPMGTGEENLGSHVSLIGFQPTRRAQTPSISRFESGKSKLRHGCAEIIAGKARVLQEFLRYLNAYRVGTQILVIGIATAVAEKSRHRIFTAGQQVFVEDIEGLINLDFCHGQVTDSWMATG